MKSVKPRKAKLVKFAEEMTAGAVPVDAATETLIESQKEEARVVPPVAAAVPREPAVVTVPAQTMAEAPARRSKAPGGLFVLALILLLTVVAGPSLILAMSAFAYPALWLVAGLAVWKLFDLFHKQGAR